MTDPDEKKIYCKECNGYLWSVSVHDPWKDLISCPFVKGPDGQCTGKFPEKGGKR